MSQTLRDEMAALMPGLRWTQATKYAVVGMLGNRRIARVYRMSISHFHLTTILDNVWGGLCRSPAHAAKTIRRKLREFRDICDQALEEST